MDSESTPDQPVSDAAGEASETHEQTIARLREELAHVRAVIDQLPYAVYWKDQNLVYRGCNRRFALDIGLSHPSEVVGKTEADLPWQAAEVTTFEQIDRTILETQATQYDDTETVIHPDGTQEWFETYKMPLTDASGALLGILATYNNITARKTAEIMVRAQAALLQELSSPIIPITDQVLVVPLIGTISSERARDILERVLEEVAARRAEVVILDITGVPIVDTYVAQALIQTGRAVQLLGAQLVLTGIRPEVAQAIVGLGITLEGTVTHSTLQQCLASIMGRQIERR